MSDDSTSLSDRRLTQTAWLAELKQIVDELDSGSDRAVAIVGVALLDEKLRQGLEAVFDPSLGKRERKSYLKVMSLL